MKSSILVLLGLLGILACSQKPAKQTHATSDNPVVELGKHLYFEKRLSADNTVSCNSCHDITNRKGGVDSLPTSVGIKNQVGGRNAPTVWNATFLSVQFWDGRAKDLVEQAKGPITNPIEMGMPSHNAAVNKIKAIKGYQDLFAKAFPNQSDPVNINNLAIAIAAFEKTLVTLNSPFDRFKAGDKTAMSQTAQNGYKKFQSVGCTTCHSGDHFAGPPMPIGTGFYMKFPTFPNSNYDKKYKFTSDKGRFEVTKDKADKFFFRVPTLRNIARTGPYFHNGKVNSLEEAVKVMGKTQLNLNLSKTDVTEIVAFLKALDGELPDIKPPSPLN